MKVLDILNRIEDGYSALPGSTAFRHTKVALLNGVKCRRPPSSGSLMEESAVIQTFKQRG